MTELGCPREAVLPHEMDATDAVVPGELHVLLLLPDGGTASSATARTRNVRCDLLAAQSRPVHLVLSQLPTHLPLLLHDIGNTHSGRSKPNVIGVHVPVRQLLHASVQAVSQHAPSLQNPVRH